MRRTRVKPRQFRDSEFQRGYKAENPYCELWGILHLRGVPCDRKATELHHIFGGNGRRYDVQCNVIHLCGAAHAWCHEHPIDGRIACLYVKEAKCELDRAEFRGATGYSLDGWLESKGREHRLPWVESYWWSLVEGGA